MSQPNSSESQKLVKLSPSICPEHNLPFQTYCSNESCCKKIRVCAQCKDKHSNHSSKYFTPGKQVVEEMTQGLKQCLEKIDKFDERSKELGKLKEKAKAQWEKEYGDSGLLENLVGASIKEDNDSCSVKLKRMKEIQVQVEQNERIKVYFSGLQQSNLLLLRIKLSSDKGITDLKEKNERLCTAMSKSSLDQIQKLYDEFNSLKQRIETEFTNCFSFHMGQVIALKNANMKNSSKAVEKGKENTGSKGDKREKNKPKTMIDFGENIINGIKNFLNF